MKNRSVRFITEAALIAALYGALTAALWQFSSMAIQVRAAEALCVLVIFTPAAVPGLFIGCFMANLISGTWVDVVFGSLTTLAASALGRRISCSITKIDIIPNTAAMLLIPLPTVLLNAIAVPLILLFGYGSVPVDTVKDTLPIFGTLFLSVLMGECIACYGLGIPLARLLNRINKKRKIF